MHRQNKISRVTPQQCHMAAGREVTFQASMGMFPGRHRKKSKSVGPMLSRKCQHCLNKWFYYSLPIIEYYFNLYIQKAKYNSQIQAVPRKNAVCSAIENEANCRHSLPILEYYSNLLYTEGQVQLSHSGRSKKKCCMFGYRKGS